MIPLILDVSRSALHHHAQPLLPTCNFVRRGTAAWLGKQTQSHGKRANVPLMGKAVSVSVCWAVAAPQRGEAGEQDPSAACGREQPHPQFLLLEEN